jgi:hypothetical protein
METEYTYWEVEYISCEGNRRTSTWAAPADFTEYDVDNHIMLGGCGDDPAEILSIEETHCDNFFDATNYIWEREY